MGQTQTLVKQEKLNGKENHDQIEVTSRLLNIIFDLPIDQQLELLQRLDTMGYKGVRKHERTLLKKPWAVYIEPAKESRCDSSIRDISRCGMFIQTRRIFEVGEKIVMKFQIPSTRRIFRIIGEIVRNQKDGVGVKFKRQLA